MHLSRITVFVFCNSLSTGDFRCRLLPRLVESEAGVHEKLQRLTAVQTTLKHYHNRESFSLRKTLQITIYKKNPTKNEVLLIGLEICLY